MGHERLEECVRSNLLTYLDDLQGQEPNNMYEMLLRTVEHWPAAKTPLLLLVQALTAFIPHATMNWR